MIGLYRVIGTLLVVCNAGRSGQNLWRIRNITQAVEQALKADIPPMKGHFIQGLFQCL